jgi:hypothetical protein
MRILCVILLVFGIVNMVFAVWGLYFILTGYDYSIVQFIVSTGVGSLNLLQAHFMSESLE